MPLAVVGRTQRYPLRKVACWRRRPGSRCADAGANTLTAAVLIVIGALIAWDVL